MKKLVSVASPRGYLAIDSTINGKAWGGIRFQKEISETEILRMAHAMTLKFGFSGIPQGGAKAVIIGDPDAPHSDRLNELIRFGRKIRPFLHEGSFNPAGDMGTSNADIEYMLRSLNVEKQLSNYRSSLSGFYTAVSVAAGAASAMQHSGKSLRDASVVIDGFGSVGSNLAMILTNLGAKVIGIGNSSGAVYQPGGIRLYRFVRFLKGYGPAAIQAYPDGVPLTTDQLISLPADIVCPCSIHYRIRSRNADTIQARIVCAGSNLPVTSQAESHLMDKGVLCLPHFITNCGGVLGGTMEFASIPVRKIQSIIYTKIKSATSQLLLMSEELRVPCAEIAEAVAQNSFKVMKRRAGSPGLKEHLMRLIVNTHHMRLLPQALVGAIAPIYFKGAIAKISPDNFYS